MTRPVATAVLLQLTAVAVCQPPPFLPTSMAAIGGGDGARPAWVDVNGDGWPDLVRGQPVLGGTGVVFRCWGPTGNGGTIIVPISDTGVPAPICQHYALCSGDLNGDGLADVFVSRFVSVVAPPLPDVIYLGQPGGSLVRAAHPIAQGTAYTFDASLADLDRDGDLDVVSINANYQCRILFNQGALGFLEAPQSMLPLAADAYPQRTLTLDVDRDGDQDLVLACGVPGGPPRQHLLCWNDGSGRFTITALPGLSGRAEFVSACDLNGDGWQDVVFVDGNPGPQVLINVAGSLAAGVASVPAVGLFRWMDAVDFDLDGDLDLVGVTLIGWQPVLLENMGGLTWVDASSRLSGLPPSNARGFFVDYDGDGDLDLVWGGAVFPSTIRHLQLTVPPTRGATCRFEAYAQGGHFLIPAISLGTGNVPIAGLGTLWLNANQLATLPILNFPAWQSQAIQLSIPNQGNLLGHRLAMQALDVDLAGVVAPHLTNAPSAAIQ